MVANPQNLKVPTSEEARKNGAKGGKKSAANRAAKKKLKEELEMLLCLTEKNGKTVQENVCIALLKKAKKGNVKAFELIRDTTGQKAPEKSEVDVGGRLEKILIEVVKAPERKD